MDSQYKPKKVEIDAQEYWLENECFRATEDVARDKFYCLAMFPYPSGKLHMGHVRNYTITDVIARYQRMLGKNVLHPMGWDAFGLPAENAAIQNNTAPANWTYQNIAYMKKQLQSLGFGFDWSREFATCQPEYYKWEQWFFTRLYEKGLVYKKMSTVNWDPVDCTVLANEQVIDGRGWRSGALVERKDIPQWFVRITAYAEELLEGLDSLPGWPEQVKTMQRNWIGKSRGIDIRFALQTTVGEHESFTVYTTRPDTLMGATYASLAAEHPVGLALARQSPELANFIEECKKQSLAEADLATMDKKGIDTGICAIHPISGRRIPLWVANYVLMEYGSGAVMAVPAHDERDFAFARTYDLPIEQVIDSNLDEDPPFDAQKWQDWYARKDSVRVVNSGEFDGLDFNGCFDAMAAKLRELGSGEVRINYRLRDWGVSRQRYWGAPIPMFSMPDGGEIPVPEERLPILLPEDVVMDGVNSPIKSDPDWRRTTLDGQAVEYETDTFDTFMESSWYYARFTCPDFSEGILDSDRANYWLPVDQYVGGIEHAILHLLYARFYHKLLRDDNFVHCDEPFDRLLCQGMVLANSFCREKSDGNKEWINPADVAVEHDTKGKIISATEIRSGKPVEFTGVTKMSKSKNNGVDPQAAIDRYGADTVRIFTMFAAPPEQTLEWNDDGVAGAQRFLKRLWNYCSEHSGTIAIGRESLSNNFMLSREDVGIIDEDLKEVRHAVYTHLDRALGDYEKNQFNTVIAACMSISNSLPSKTDSPCSAQVVAEGTGILLRLLSPVAPHITHLLWRELGYGSDILESRWPERDSDALQRSSIELVVQVNGKLRGKISVSADAGQDAVEAMALEQENVRKFLSGDTIRKIIVVPGKLVNIVASK